MRLGDNIPVTRVDGHQEVVAIKQSARQILRIPPLERLRLGIVEGSVAWHEEVQLVIIE